MIEGSASEALNGSLSMGNVLTNFFEATKLAMHGANMERFIASGRGLLLNVITTPEDVKAFHSDSPSHSKSTSSNGGWLFHQLLGDCMGLINGRRWKRTRSQFDPYFMHRTVASHSNNVDIAAAEYLRSLRSKQSEDIELHAAAEFCRFPFMTTAEYIYGPLDRNEKEELWSLGQRSLGLMGTVLSGGVYRFGLCQLLKPRTNFQLKRFQADWIAFNKVIVDSREANHRQHPPIVEAWKSVEEGHISTNEMIQTLSEMLFANLDVSTHVLSWLIIFIAQDAEVQTQLRKEISGNSGRLSEFCSRKKYPIASLLFGVSTASAVDGSVTLFVGPHHHSYFADLSLTVFSIPECSPQAKIIGGYIIPPQTSVVVDTLAINHNRHFWGDKCLDFNPYHLQNLSSTELRYNIFTFGFGTRKCLGQHFAETMVKLFVCHLLDCYEIRLPEEEAGKDENSPPSVETWVPVSDARIILKPI
ncbi:hypothetical protein N7486_004413 [Penicillium sp. IBT 16267x]|nr:hypothetical protein N7486_004413 [Penicillium sp. IBT 16267x]